MSSRARSGCLASRACRMARCSLWAVSTCPCRCRPSQILARIVRLASASMSAASAALSAASATIRWKATSASMMASWSVIFSASTSGSTAARVSAAFASCSSEM